jgi:hypothetical protein
MARKVITVTHPDGTKKVIVGQESNKTLVKTREGVEERRVKPLMSKAGTTSTKTAYKLGGKINVRKR